MRLVLMVTRYTVKDWRGGQGDLTGAGGVGDPPQWLLGEAWSLAKGASYTEPCPFLVAA